MSRVTWDRVPGPLKTQIKRGPGGTRLMWGLVAPELGQLKPDTTRSSHRDRPASDFSTFPLISTFLPWEWKFRVTLTTSNFPLSTKLIITLYTIEQPLNEGHTLGSQMSILCTANASLTSGERTAPLPLFEGSIKYCSATLTYTLCMGIHGIVISR